MGRRGRTLSEEGKTLLCEAYSPTITKSCIRTLLHNLFSSEYDEHLNDSVQLFRRGSEILISRLNEIKLSENMDNAIHNIIGLILKKQNGQGFKKKYVKDNLRWYLNIAVRAMKEKDHNTAVMLRIILSHASLSRLNLFTSSMTEKIKALEEEYGSFNNCQQDHIKKILKKDVSVFQPGQEIPSAMVLEMYQKRTKQHKKALQKIGKVPQTLLSMHDRLCEYQQILLHNFQSKTHLDMIPLYTEKPCISRQEIFQLSDKIKNIKSH